MFYWVFKCDQSFCRISGLLITLLNAVFCVLQLWDWITQQGEVVSRGITYTSTGSIYMQISRAYDTPPLIFSDIIFILTHKRTKVHKDCDLLTCLVRARAQPQSQIFQAPASAILRFTSPPVCRESCFKKSL